MKYYVIYDETTDMFVACHEDKKVVLDYYKFLLKNEVDKSFSVGKLKHPKDFQYQIMDTYLESYLKTYIPNKYIEAVEIFGMNDILDSYHDTKKVIKSVLKKKKYLSEKKIEEVKKLLVKINKLIKKYETSYYTISELDEIYMRYDEYRNHTYNYY